MTVHTEKGNLIQKSPKYGVGKQMGNILYVHQSAEDVIPSDLLYSAKEELPPDFIYTIGEINEIKQKVQEQNEFEIVKLSEIFISVSISNP